MDWASEIINILEKEIRYDLSSKLDVFFTQHGIKVDPDWTAQRTDIQTEIEDRRLDKEMEKESVPEEIGSVCQTKDGFWFLR